MKNTVLSALFGSTLFLDIAGATPQVCGNPLAGPDVIVGDLIDVGNYGATGGIGGYALGTASCNIGSVGVNWIQSTNEHPVIAQNVYRLENGRFEQIGMSWLKHSFQALQGSLCCTCQPGGSDSLLGVGCSDPYVSGYNGSQGNLGPRSEVNAYTGVFPFPFTSQPPATDTIVRRIQIPNSDLDPALHPDAEYFGEGHYVTMDDAMAGNGRNNASYRPLQVTIFQNGAWSMDLIGETERTSPAIQAWKDMDPTVQLVRVDVPHEGRFTIASKSTNNGDGTWHYEYAVHNLNSDVSGGSFSVPVPSQVNVTNIGFHDIDNHSGEPWSNIDWTGQRTMTSVSWATTPYAFDTNANALRWGTLYNFRFDADAGPDNVNATLGLFKPHSPSSVSASVFAPVGIGHPFCFGSACPCGNDSASSGCLNSTGSGAVLRGFGTTSVAADDLLLTTTGCPPNNTGLYFMGGVTFAPVFVGDGLACTGGIYRFFPGNVDASGELNQSNVVANAFPGAINPGDTRHFQSWTRDVLCGPPPAPCASPCGANSNLSNGYTIVFTP